MGKKSEGSLKEKQGLRPWQKLLAGFAVILVLVILVELFANFSYLRLDKGERGTREIGDEAIAATGFDLTEAGYAYNDEMGCIRISFGGSYVDKFIYTYDYEGLLDMHVTIQYQNDYGKTEQKVLIDKNSAALRRSVINIGAKVEWIELYTDTPLLLEEGVEYLDLTEFPLTITGFSVDNSFHWNTSRMLFVFLAGTMLLLILVFRDFLGKKLEFAFLLVSLGCGILILSCLPAPKVSWDEEIHFRRAYELSLYPGGEETSPEFVELFNSGIKTWALSLPASAEEKADTWAYFDETIKSGGTGAVVASSGIDTYTTGYVIPALFLKVGRFLHMPFSMLYQFGRLGGLLLYCLIMALAIRILPAGKRILMVIGLMPTPMLLASCYSYDSVVTAFISLGLAFLLRQIMDRERPFSWTEYFLGLAFLVWGILPKAVYAPLLLTGLLIPAAKFKNKKQKLLSRVGFILVCLALLSTFVLPSLLSPGNYGDSRGGNVDVMAQMKNILFQPLVYLKLLVANIWRKLPSYLCGKGVFQILGHWGYAGFGTVATLYFVGTVATDGSGLSRPVLGKWQKLFLAVLLAGTVALVWTAFYLTYTEPGSSIIEGVQGRYFLPVLLPLALLAGNRRIKLGIPDHIQNLGMICISAFLCLSMVWMKILI